MHYLQHSKSIFYRSFYVSCWHECPCHSIWTAYNDLTGSSPSELGELKSLTWFLGWCSVRGLGWSCRHECRSCSHFIAILFEQIIINSLDPFRANSQNWRRWLICISVRGLVCLVRMNFVLAHSRSVGWDAKDVTGDLNPIFCDGSFWGWEYVYADCDTQFVCSCCSDCY
jgi:hypothetical protein